MLVPKKRYFLPTLIVLLTITTSACSSTPTAQEKVTSEDIDFSTISFDELSSSEVYLDWIGKDCARPEWDTWVSGFGFLVLPEGSTGVIKQVLESRTSRISAAANSVVESKSLAKEIAAWDDLIEEYDGQLLEDMSLSFWNKPDKGIEWGVKRAFADAVAELTGGVMPNATIVQAIFDDWIASCEYQESLDEVSSDISKYSAALSKLRATIKESLLTEGFLVNNENLLTKISIETEDGFKFPVVEFYPMSDECTHNNQNLRITVTIPGREDSDGITAADYVEDYFDLIDTKGMSVYERGKLKPNAIGFYDSDLLAKVNINKAKVSRADCG